MDRHRFVTLAVVALGAVVLGFVVRGVTRVVVGVDVANVLAAPLVLGGFGLVVLLTGLAGLGALGVGPLRARDND